MNNEQNPLWRNGQMPVARESEPHPEPNQAEEQAQRQNRRSGKHKQSK